MSACSSDCYGRARGESQTSGLNGKCQGVPFQPSPGGHYTDRMQSDRSLVYSSVK